MSAALLVLALAVFLSAAMALAWRVVQSGASSGWIDATWTFAVGLAGVAGALALPAPTPARAFLVAALAAVWSLRLGLHIAARTMRGGDDPRYKALRAEWGDKAGARLFQFLQAQAGAALVLAVALALAAHRPGAAPDFRDLAGVALFAFALIGEAVADRQLSAFAKNPNNRGRVCDVGLWAWSRHPNYFCEWLVWVAVALIAFDPGWPWGWIAWAAPVLMYVLLVHVSGVPPLESHMLRSRGDAFRAYQAGVSAFFPWPPRSPAKGVST